MKFWQKGSLRKIFKIRKIIVVEEYLLLMATIHLEAKLGVLSHVARVLCELEGLLAFQLEAVRAICLKW